MLTSSAILVDDITSPNKKPLPTLYILYKLQDGCWDIKIISETNISINNTIGGLHKQSKENSMGWGQSILLKSSAYSCVQSSWPHSVPCTINTNIMRGV